MFDVSRLVFQLESGFYTEVLTDSGAHFMSVIESTCSRVKDGAVTVFAKGEQGQLEKGGWTPLEMSIKLLVEVLDGDDGQYLVVRTAERVQDLIYISVMADGDEQGRGRLQIGRGGQFGLVRLADCPNLGAGCSNYLPK